MTTNYLVFLQNTQTGEEFTAPTVAPENAHEIAMGKLRQQYPAPKFKVHTAYATQELETALNGLSRWPGLASSVQAGARRAAPTKTAPVSVSLAQATQQATGAKIEKTVEKVAEKPTLQKAVSKLSTEKPSPTPTPTAKQTSVIEHLKALRG